MKIFTEEQLMSFRSGDGADWREGESGACGRADAEDSGDVGGDAGD